MTTSPGPAAQRPPSRRKGVRRSKPCVRASSPTPKYGPSPSGLPSRPTILASSVMSPAATSTPGTSRTRSSAAASTVGLRTAQSSLESTANAVRALTTASVPP